MTHTEPAAGSRAHEDGFTLLELVISIAITGLIVVSMGLAISQGFSTSTATKTSINRSVLGNFAARDFGADIASATFGSGAVATSNPPPPACGSGTPAIDIQTGVATVVSYAVTQSAAGRASLVRSVCSGTLGSTLTQTASRTIGTTDAPLGAGSACTAATAPVQPRCTLTLTWSSPSYSLTISGTRWVNATTTTT